MKPHARFTQSIIFAMLLASGFLASAQTPNGKHATAETKTAPPKASDAYNFVASVPYVHSAGASMVADLYVPHGTGPFPGIVFVHGGGWHGGDRTQLRRLAAHMAESGMFGMAIDYRLAPTYPYPAALEDSKQFPAKGG